MRFGIVLRATGGERPLADLVAQARAAEEAGFDLLWVEEDRGVCDGGAGVAVATGLPDALAIASALAPHTTWLRVGACCRAGTLHPAYLAEQAAVVDLVLGGRLVLGLRPAPGAEALLGDVTDLVALGHASAPFRRKCEPWPMPAELDGNRFGVTEEVAVMPNPAQLELPVWLAGPSAAVTEVVSTRALSMVADDVEDAASVARRWQAVERALGPAALRLRRVARRAVPVDAGGSFDLDGLRDRLRQDQRAWRMDTVLLDAPPGAGADVVADLVAAVARRVRPRLAMAGLPPGLVEHWEAMGYGAGSWPQVPA
jgi:hypothetical protein